MKAAVCYEFGQPLVIEEIVLDPPQSSEVQVKLTACAICHSDIHYLEGAWGGALPAVYGHEAAGVVTHIGPGVSSVQPGDHVVVTLIRHCGRCYFCAQGNPHLCEARFSLDQQSRLRRQDGQTIQQSLRTGGFAESVVVDQSQVIPISSQMPLPSASLLACGVITGLGAVVNTAKVTAGESVVVIGTGGVGLNSIQGGRLCGAQPIIGVDLVDSKLAAARQFGASHTLNPGRDEVPAAVAALTGGRGADYVFVTVGSGPAMEQGLELLRRGGTLVVVGMPASGVKMGVEVANFADASQRILGSKMGSARPGVDIPKLVALYQEGRIKLDELISGRYPLESINEAIAAVKRGEALRNVILF